MKFLLYITHLDTYGFDNRGERSPKDIMTQIRDTLTDTDTGDWDRTLRGNPYLIQTGLMNTPDIHLGTSYPTLYQIIFSDTDRDGIWRDEEGKPIIEILEWEGDLYQYKSLL